MGAVLRSITGIQNHSISQLPGSKKVDQEYQENRGGWQAEQSQVKKPAGQLSRPEVGSRYNLLTIGSANEKSSREEGKTVVMSEKPRTSAKAIQKAHAELLVVEDEANAILDAVLDQVTDTQGSLIQAATQSGLSDTEVFGKDEGIPLSRALTAMRITTVPTPPTGNRQAY